MLNTPTQYLHTCQIRRKDKTLFLHYSCLCYCQNSLAQPPWHHDTQHITLNQKGSFMTRHKWYSAQTKRCHYAKSCCANSSSSDESLGCFIFVISPLSWVCWKYFAQTDWRQAGRKTSVDLIYYVGSWRKGERRGGNAWATANNR